MEKSLDKQKLLEKKLINCWTEAKEEIFRLQLFNEYHTVEDLDLAKLERENRLNILDDQNFKQWVSDIETKSKEGVRIINVHVIDLPLTEYHRLGIKYYLTETSKKGQESFFVERKDVADMISKFQDYWMFDSKNIILMDYGSDGTYVGVGGFIVMNNNNKYSMLRDKLMKKVLPMMDFLKSNRIGLKKDDIK